MTLSQTAPKINHNILSFTQAPVIARRVRSLMTSFAAGRISRAARNEYLGDILPLHEWVDVGTYRVKFDGHTKANRSGNAYPVITFQGGYSLSGTCPVCFHDKPGEWLSGTQSVQLWCHNCGAIYESPEGVLK